MVQVTNWKVDFEKWHIFRQLVKTCNGRYLSNPYRAGKNVIVDITFENGDDYSRFWHAWYDCTTNIVEVRKDQWWRILGRRFKQIVTFS